MLSLRQDRRQQMALKVALGALIATLLILWMHAENPFWAPALVIVFMHDYFEGSVANAMQRVLSTVAGGLLGIWVAHYTIHSELFFVLTLCIVIAVCIFGFLVYGSGWLNVAVTFSFVYLYVMLNPTGGFDIAYWRLLQIVLAAVVWVFMSAFLFPNHAYADTQKSFRVAIKQYADFLRTGIFAEDISWEKVKNDLSKNFTLIQKTADILPDKLSSANKTAAAKEALTHFWVVWRSLGKLIDSPNVNIQDYQQPLHKTANALDALVETNLSAKSCENFLSTITTLLDELADQHTEKHSANANEQFAFFYENLITVISNLTAWLHGAHLRERAIERRSLAFIWHDIRSRPERVRHCLCAGLGCGLIVAIWFITDWEGGICAIISALVVAADFSLTKINLKIRLRIYGSFVGSVVAMLCVIFVAKNIALLVLCIFVGVLCFGYLATGNFKQMYFSWMATMSYVITLIPSNQIIANFDFAIERSAGLIFGLVMMLFVMNFFFQINPDRIMDRHERRILGKMAGFFSALGLIVAGDAAGEKRLQDAAEFLRDQLPVGDTMAKETDRQTTWTPIRDLVVRVLWCYRYTKRTTVLDNTPEKEIETAILAACRYAESRLDPHAEIRLSPPENFREDWDDASANLFFHEMNTLIEIIRQYEAPKSDNVSAFATPSHG